MLLRAVALEALLSLTEATEPHASEGLYQVARAGEVTRWRDVARAGEVTRWRELASLPKIWLNIGGAANRHPRHHYEDTSQSKL